MSQAAERFMVISADCHAGLPNAEYRDWLDPSFHEAFDESLVDRARVSRSSRSQGFLNKEFAKEWAEENEDGLRGSWDAGRARQGARRATASSAR